MEDKEELFQVEALKNSAVNLNEVEDKGEPPPPDMTDPGWSDYVIEQLAPDEMYEGNPTTDGLRRLANKLLGTIVESVPIIAQSPTPQNDNHATIGWKLVIRWGDNPDDIRTFGDVADVYIGNTDQMYAVFASATAATRAEGRALRKALQLKRVVTSEEITDVPAEDPTKITKAQVSFIDQLCQPDRNNINVNKLLALSKIRNIKSIEEVPHATAIQIIKYLSDCQRGAQTIPEPIKGYDPNWRNNE